MEILNYKGFDGSAELDMSSMVCRGKLLFIDDLVTYKSRTPATLQSEFEAAVEDYIATCLALGRQPQRPFRGQFNVRVPAALHRRAALRAVADSVALNEVVIRALDAYLSICAQVNNNIHVTVQAPDAFLQTVSAVGSNSPTWESAYDQ